MRKKHSFFRQDALIVAPGLFGSLLVRKFEDGRIESKMITEVEAYRGEEDLACHARMGRTKRTQALYGEAGRLYVYLIYGMYWMLNTVTGQTEEPQGVLIRSVDGVTGPGRVGRWLQLDDSFYGEDLAVSERIWIEPGKRIGAIQRTARIGVDYAGEWAKKQWRFVLEK